MDTKTVRGSQRPHSSSGDSDWMLKGKDMEDLVESDDSLELVKDEYFFERGIPAKVTCRAPLPTNPSYYTDIMLCHALSYPDASVSLGSQNMKS